MQTTAQVATFELPLVHTECRSQVNQNTALGVVCLHCGAPIRFDPRENAARLAQHVSLIWCRLCEREAPYRPADVIDLLAATNGADA
jgi:hypothetical protein